MIADIREWHAADPDWHQGREKIAGLYNYQNYGGNCHMVPNHALILLGLLYGAGDFNKSMLIVNTAGWDTDCNSGNLGCLLGIKDGLSTFDNGNDWRGPVGDRLYLPAADGGRSVTDAVIETGHIVNIGRALAGEEAISFKNNARFHFEFPGSVQGFRADQRTTRIKNSSAYSHYGRRSLAIQFQGKGSVATPTFILPDELDMAGYQYIASPTLYPGQQVKAGLTASGETSGRLFVRVYNHADRLDTVYGPEIELKPNAYTEVSWLIPNTHGQPIAEVGLAVDGEGGHVYLDYLTWVGAPDVTFTRPFGAVGPKDPPQVWRQAWVNGVDTWGNWWPQPFRLVQNDGRGLLMQGTREWTDYRVEASVTPWLMDAGGIAARVQGLKRYYGLLLTKGNKLRLIKALDGDQVLDEMDFAWELNQAYDLTLEVVGARIRGWINGDLAFDVTDDQDPLTGGGVAYVIELGHLESQAMVVGPLR
jgi:hypothetical protein